MLRKYKLKKDDPIIVISGKEKGKTSKVLKIDRTKDKVFAEGLNIVKRHVKPNQLNPEGGIVEKEMPIHISNVMYYCKKCDKGVRLGYKVLESGNKQRFCKSCGEIIDKD
ncbi:MAG: 50S ribosomal protein L24 [Deferribacterales bacterium]|jgi:large subunit ribosomal protein L24|uniref:50S ribosomal protein L24 n=1 Tax=Deferrivibrio essentukiensis TaxID=2880922 RepID=UPI0019A34B7A|nr:50S ribosomal protein L24 [Deferrivibrio essentukiensis]MBC7195665.1 50S ribosomal protein L24 [Deferribacterales bacterium]MBZ4672530.1 rplX [Deferribacteraceae bacterium]MCB4205113.1 50S ribosomal protein L24 [Deferrivibrio essentukiensis]